MEAHITQRHDIAIVGGGITAWATAYHLRQLGATDVCLIHDPERPSATLACPGWLAGGMADNYTRLSHGFGRAFAQEIWAFGNAAQAMACRYLTEQAIPHQKGRRLRLASTEHEVKELAIAVRELHADGFGGAELVTGPAVQARFPLLSARVLGVQIDDALAARVDPALFLPSFAPPKPAPPAIEGRVSQLRETSTGVTLTVTLPHGEVQTHSAELVVLACHHFMKDLVPALREAVVPYGDQVARLGALPAGDAPHFLVASHNHGYEWLLHTPDSSYLGGGRYLRKWAGIGEEQPSATPRIAAKVAQSLNALFVQGADGPPSTPPLLSQLTTTGDPWGLVEVRPCDELPLIGPMFGCDRVLLATGFMGQGLTLGFMAGLCLAELIVSGKSPRLPRRLWPERLRSLAD